MSHPNARRESGFTILETMVAMVILSVGLLAIASLFAKTTTSSNMSRYMSTQSLAGFREAGRPEPAAGRRPRSCRSCRSARREA